MNYLFFDIECCDGTHICSLGYVLIDENFHIVEKRDIVINPELPIRLGKNSDMKLFYSSSVFNNNAPFPTHYKKIIKLLTQKRCILIGFAIENDFNFINIACHRYDLPQCEFKGFDVQKLEKLLTNDKCVHSLEKVADAHNIPYGMLSLHKSCDDAQLTMYIMRSICFENNLSIKDALTLFPQCFAQSKFYIPKPKRIVKRKPNAKEPPQKALNNTSQSNAKNNVKNKNNVKSNERNSTKNNTNKSTKKTTALKNKSLDKTSHKKTNKKTSLNPNNKLNKKTNNKSNNTAMKYVNKNKTKSL